MTGHSRDTPGQTLDATNQHNVLRSILHQGIRRYHFVDAGLCEDMNMQSVHVLTRTALVDVSVSTYNDGRSMS